MTTPNTDSPPSRGTHLLIGIVAGAALGGVLNYWAPKNTLNWILTNITEPLGTGFLRALMMLAVPLVFSSLVVGVARLGTVQKVGRMTGRLIVFYLFTTAIAIGIGTSLTLAFHPGESLSIAHVESAMTAENDRIASLAHESLQTPDSLWPGFLYKLIPESIPLATAQGNMLAVIFASLLFGFALASVDVSRSGPALKTVSAVAEALVAIVGWIMRFAPLFLGILTLNVAARIDPERSSVVIGLAGVVLGGCALHFLILLVFVHQRLRIPAWRFLRRAAPALGTAFSTSSSNAAMPTTIHTLETRFGVPPSVTTLSVPIGTTVNMDGTALFQAAAAVFVGQIYGIELVWPDYLTLMVFVLISSVGISGVPGGSIPVLITAMGTIGVPPEGIALVLAVDRALDMFRTMINVTGDMVGTLYLHDCNSAGAAVHTAAPAPKRRQSDLSAEIGPDGPDRRKPSVIPAAMRTGRAPAGRQRARTPGKKKSAVSDTD